MSGIRPGPRNSLTDVGGLLVGNAEDKAALSGTTVVLCDGIRAVAAADVRGGGPGTRETDALAPARLVDGVDAVVLSGGSAYTVPVPKAARGVCQVRFDDLCGKPLGAEDYLTLAKRYHTVILDGVPRLSEDRRNEAKRFMTLIDALYERHCNLIMAADAAPNDLYREGTHAFEFERAVSRLMEMQSAEYREKPHRD